MNIHLLDVWGINVAKDERKNCGKYEFFYGCFNKKAALVETIYSERVYAFSSTYCFCMCRDAADIFTVPNGTSKGGRCFTWPDGFRNTVWVLSACAVPNRMFAVTQKAKK